MRSKLVVLFSVFLLLIIAGVGCDKNGGNFSSSKEGEKNYWLAYEETQCNSYPWERGKHVSSLQKESFLSIYEDRYGIVILDAIVVEPPQDSSCKECGCKTGKAIQVAVETKEERDALLVFGFIEIKKPSKTLSQEKQDSKDDASSIDDLLKERAEKLGETYVPSEEASLVDSGSKQVVDIPNAMEDSQKNRYSGQDGIIEQTAKYLQQMLWIYSLESGFYPETLQEIDLTGVDLTGITYIPKGEKPFSDYEFRVEYSTVIEIFHPLQ